MIKLSIIIPVFNGLDYTGKCLENLNRQLSAGTKVFHVSTHIILIDDGSGDGTASWVAANYSEVTILKGDGSFWWSGSINEGMKHAFDKLNNDFVLWWNNDILAADDYFLNLFNILQESCPDSVIGSKVFHASDKNMVWGMGGFFNRVNGRKGMHAFNVPDSPDLQSSFEVNWLPGMGTLISRKVYDRIGLLNSRDFPQYHGDSDYTFRAWLSGIKIIVRPELKIYNNIEHSGLLHGYSYNLFLRSFVSIKSKYNFKKN
ncbi:MAG: glycosyltransferase family 2 protein, partial [Bacteroidales bacterium]|nr:glycosyltransferase family 2 protein [Bacteroidales bacterium]